VKLLDVKVSLPPFFPGGRGTAPLSGQERESSKLKREELGVDVTLCH